MAGLDSNYDLDLVHRAADGDRTALTVLLQESRRPLFAIIAPKIPQDLRSVIEAEDVIQEAHVAAFRHIATFEPRSPDAFFQWLSTVAERKLFDAIKRHRAEKRGGAVATISGTIIDPRVEESVVILLDTFIAPGKTPSSTARRNEAVEEVLRALEQLPPDQERAVHLIHLDGVPVEQVAEQLGRTEPAIRGLCRRGLETLRDRLSGPLDFLSSRG